MRCARRRPGSGDLPAQPDGGVVIGRARRRIARLGAGQHVDADAVEESVVRPLAFGDDRRFLQAVEDLGMQPHRAEFVAERDDVAFADPERVLAASEGLGAAMDSLESRKLEESQLLAGRGW